MDTFKDWPHESPVAVDALVRAGLFYTGESGYFLYVCVRACVCVCVCVC
jgi:baculoviral IAP repeat-containing protein 1